MFALKPSSILFCLCNIFVVFLGVNDWRISLCLFCISFPLCWILCMFSCFPLNWWSVSFSSWWDTAQMRSVFLRACMSENVFIFFFTLDWKFFWEILLRILKKYYSFVLWLLMFLLRCVLIYNPLCGFFIFSSFESF